VLYKYLINNLVYFIKQKLDIINNLLRRLLGLMKAQVKKLLRIIRFTPIIIILILSTLSIIILINEQKKEIEEEKKNIEKQFLLTEKERIKTDLTTVYTYSKLLINSSEDELRKDLKSKINNVYKIMANIYIKNKDKKSKAEIIAQIKEAVDTIRYNDGDGYFSIHTLEGINILQPVNRSYEGTNIFNRKDSKGAYPIQKAIKIAKTKGEGFFNWYFLKPSGGESKEFEKLGIVKLFEPYGLIITTGIYRGDFENTLKNKILNYISQIKYINNGYVFIIGFNGDIVYHPSKKAKNANIFNEKRFAHMSNMYKNLILKEGTDIDDYFLITPKVLEGIATKETKITYSKRIDDLDWVIGTNFKLSDPNSIIEKMKIKEEKKYENYKKEILFYGLILTIVLIIISFFVSKLLEKEFLKYKNRIEEEKDKLLLSQRVAKVGDWQYNLNTNKSYFSQEVKKMFGIKEVKDNIFIDYLRTVLHKDDLNRVMKAFKNTIETGEDYHQIYRIYRPNNEIRWISSKATLDKDKKWIKGVSQDITELKELEIDKIKKDELVYQQSKMAAMGEMLGNIAHQWRQPLSTISTASTGTKLQKEMNCLSDEQLDSALVTINNSAQYLSQTIDDFRGFFNPSNNKIKEFDILDTFIRTLKLISAQFNAKDIEIIKVIKPQKLSSIENELIQVLINILNNSRDALITKEKGKRLLFINTYTKEKNLYIEILDNAGGIQKDIINRIFEPYFTTKHKSQGTGIGLYMSQDIISNHLNGSLSVSNKNFVYEDVPYISACFTIGIPLA